MHVYRSDGIYIAGAIDFVSRFYPIPLPSMSTNSHSNVGQQVSSVVKKEEIAPKPSTSLVKENPATSMTQNNSSVKRIDDKNLRTIISTSIDSTSHSQQKVSYITFSHLQFVHSNLVNDFQVEFFSFNHRKLWKLSVCKKVINQVRVNELYKEAVANCQPLTPQLNVFHFSPALI